MYLREAETQGQRDPGTQGPKGPGDMETWDLGTLGLGRLEWGLERREPLHLFSVGSERARALEFGEWCSGLELGIPNWDRCCGLVANSELVRRKVCDRTYGSLGLSILLSC